MMHFDKIDISVRDVHARYWAATPVHPSDTTFTNIWGWAPFYGLEYAEGHGLFWIRRTRAGAMPTSTTWGPIGDWDAADWDAAVAETPAGSRWERVPDALCSLLAARFPDRVSVEETRDQWDYLYAQADLASLAGRRYSRKRNHLNAYRKAYGLDYRAMTARDVGTMLHCQYDWCRYHECEHSPILEMENDALIRMLTYWEALPSLRAAAMLVDDRIVAFTVGEPMDDTTVVIHAEKALPEYDGAYQAINLCFARNAAEGYALINREQDAGEEGLRQAKESYLPCGFVVKNRIVFR